MRISGNRPRVIILAAGRGRRMGAATKNLPKALLPLASCDPSPTFLGRLMSQLSPHCQVVVVAGWKSRCIRNFLLNCHPETPYVVNRIFASSGSLQSLRSAVTAHPCLMDSLSPTIYCDADIILSNNLAQRILEWSGPSVVVVGRNAGQRDDEQVGVFGSRARPLFLGKALDHKSVGSARWLGEAAGVVILSPADQHTAISSMDRILKLSLTAEHEDLTRELISNGRMKCLVARPNERFVECDTPEDLRIAEKFLNEIPPAHPPQSFCP